MNLANLNWSKYSPKKRVSPHMVRRASPVYRRDFGDDDCFTNLSDAVLVLESVKNMVVHLSPSLTSNMVPFDLNNITHIHDGVVNFAGKLKRCSLDLPSLVGQTKVTFVEQVEEARALVSFIFNKYKQNTTDAKVAFNEKLVPKIQKLFLVLDTWSKMNFTLESMIDVLDELNELKVAKAMQITTCRELETRYLHVQALFNQIIQTKFKKPVNFVEIALPAMIEYLEQALRMNADQVNKLDDHLKFELAPKDAVITNVAAKMKIKTFTNKLNDIIAMLESWKSKKDVEVSMANIAEVIQRIIELPGGDCAQIKELKISAGMIIKQWKSNNLKDNNTFEIQIKPHIEASLMHLDKAIFLSCTELRNNDNVSNAVKAFREGMMDLLQFIRKL